jgi:hypothetical protein
MNSINIGSIIKEGDIPFAQVTVFALSFVTTSKHVAKRSVYVQGLWFRTITFAGAGIAKSI